MLRIRIARKPKDRHLCKSNSDDEKSFKIPVPERW